MRMKAAQYIMDADKLSAFYDQMQVIIKEETDFKDPTDYSYAQQVHLSSQVYEVVGRGLIHFSLDPLTWSLGVSVLSLHFIQEWNLAHAVIHKTYDGISEAKKFHLKNANSRSVHMGKFIGARGHLSHHSHTAVLDRDADFSHHGWDRVSPKLTWKPHHLLQLALGPLAFPFSLWAQTIHYSGFTDFLSTAKTRPIFLKEKSFEEFKIAVKDFADGFVPYFAYNYVLFPALAGPMFLKVAAGNFCAEVLCNIWMAAVNLGNHLGGDTELLNENEEPKGRRQYLLKTIRVCNDFVLPRVIEFHTGGLNYHLAHHLAPKLPPNRLRRLTRKVKNLCKEYNVKYNEKGLVRSAAASLGKILYYALPVS